jgi:cytoskeletal protein RodZ
MAVGPPPVDDGAEALGAAMRAARMDAGRSIEDIAASTRIRAGLLRAMEAGDFAPCGGHVYARGHLRAFAVALGLPADTFIAAYDGMADTQVEPLVTSALPPEDQAADPLALRDLGGRRARRPSTWLVAAVGAAFVIAVIAGVSYLGGSGGGHATAGSTPSSGTSPSAARTNPHPAGSTPQATQTVASSGVNVDVAVHDSPSWVHVVDETGAVLFQGTLEPGTNKPFHATQELKFVFGYAPAIDLTVNGRQVGQPPPQSGDVATVSFDTNSGAAG